MAVSIPKFTGQQYQDLKPEDSKGLGPTPTLFGTGQPNSTVYLYYNRDVDSPIGQCLVNSEGKWLIGIHLRYTDQGNANVIAASASYGREMSGWADDLVIYP